jgi:hypothetical protein
VTFHWVRLAAQVRHEQNTAHDRDDAQREADRQPSPEGFPLPRRTSQDHAARWARSERRPARMTVRTCWAYSLKSGSRQMHQHGEFLSVRVLQDSCRPTRHQEHIRRIAVVVTESRKICETIQQCELSSLPGSSATHLRGRSISGRRRRRIALNHSLAGPRWNPLQLAEDSNRVRTMALAILRVLLPSGLSTHTFKLWGANQGFSCATVVHAPQPVRDPVRRELLCGCLIGGNICHRLLREKAGFL